MGIEWVYENLRCGFEDTIEEVKKKFPGIFYFFFKIENFKKSRLFRKETALFIKSVTEEFLSSNSRQQQQIFLAFEEFSKKFHDGWKIFKLAAKQDNFPKIQSKKIFF